MADRLTDTPESILSEGIYRKVLSAVSDLKAVEKLSNDDTIRTGAKSALYQLRHATERAKQLRDHYAAQQQTGLEL